MDEGEQPIGTIIRRIRRQRNLTQIQLGGESYSKSYVSALEHGKLSPSIRALQFFAGQLALPEDYFTALVEEAESRQQLVEVGEHSSSARGNGPWLSSEEWQMLDALLEHVHDYSEQALHTLPALSLEQLTILPSTRQAGYAYVLGMSAQQRGEYETSVHALEYALALASPQLRLAVLDALGFTHALQYTPALALHYHLRAYRLLKDISLDSMPSPLHLSITLHCGDDYLALGAYQHASSMYDEARTCLTAEHSMQTAARTFLRLGYSLYGLLSHQRLSIPAHQKSLTEEREQLFQRAISLMLQSKSIYQVSGESRGEHDALLTLTQMELDLSDEYYRCMSRQSSSAHKLLEAKCTALLDDVDEQCRQVLMFWQGAAANEAIAESHLYLASLALASLVRVHVQRARLARTSGHDDTARRERLFASSLCQEALESMSNPSPPLEHISHWLKLLNNPLNLHEPVLPRLPGQQAILPGDDMLLGSVELYLAAGEVAEELGQATQNLNFAHDCCICADSFYVAALEHAFPIVSRHAQDPGYLIRSYQRCVDLLEERAARYPDLEEVTARGLLRLLKSGLSSLPAALASSDLP